MPNSAKQRGLILARFALDGPTNECQHGSECQVRKMRFSVDVAWLDLKY